MKLVRGIWAVSDFLLDQADAWFRRVERKAQAKAMNQKAWNDIDFVEPPEDRQQTLF